MRFFTVQDYFGLAALNVKEFINNRMNVSGHPKPAR
jgi:hypothetical protein